MSLVEAGGSGFCVVVVGGGGVVVGVAVVVSVGCWSGSLLSSICESTPISTYSVCHLTI